MNFRRKEQNDSLFPQAFLSGLILFSLCDSESTAELSCWESWDYKDRVLVIIGNSRRSLHFLITADGVRSSLKRAEILLLCTWGFNLRHTTANPAEIRFAFSCFSSYTHAEAFAAWLIKSFLFWLNLDKHLQVLHNPLNKSYPDFRLLIKVLYTLQLILAKNLLLRQKEGVWVTR